MTDPEPQLGGGGEVGRRRRPPRRRSAVAAVLAAVLATLVAIVARAGDETAVVRVAEPPPEVPVTVPEPVPTVPPAPPGPAPSTSAAPQLPQQEGTGAAPERERRRIAADPRGRWALYDVGRCLELEQEQVRFERLLCDVPPASEVLGDLVAVATVAGRVIVAVADPSVTGFHSYPRQAGGFYYDSATGADADTAGLAYVAGFAAAGATDLLVRDGAHTIARVAVPHADRAYAPAELPRTTAPPYGRWRAYRHAALTGLYFGGVQELGFYSSAGGGPCVLYRRFAGPVEGVLADGCVRDGGTPHLPVAALSPVRLPQPENAFVLLAVTDLDGVALVIELPDGRALAPAGVGRHADPAGTGWAGLVQFAQHVDVPPGVQQVDFVLRDTSGAERARKAVAVPKR